VIPEKKLAFVAITKNAGTSIRVAFGNAQGFVSEGEPVERVASQPWPSVSDKATIKALRYLGFLRFCVARNPWERFVSCWQDKRADASFLRKTGFREAMEFHDFVEAAFSVPDEKANRHYRFRLSCISYRGKVLVDRLLRFENLGSDWEALRVEFDLPSLPHCKPSGAADSYRALYEKYPQTKQRLAQRYRRDIQYFGYEF
jgi:hypothetical protein